MIPGTQVNNPCNMQLIPPRALEPVADPGFSIGGGRTNPMGGGGGVPTSYVGTFWRKRLRERENWVPLVGAVRQ